MIILTLCILVDFSIHIDTDCPFLYFKGSQVEVSKLGFISLRVLILAKSADPDEMQHLLLAKMPILGFPVYNTRDKFKYKFVSDHSDEKFLFLTNIVPLTMSYIKTLSRSNIFR